MSKLILSLCCFLPVLVIVQNKDKKTIAAYLDRELGNTNCRHYYRT
ncbi:hypothetical protein [Chitinophaga sp. S165]|nr:hypothetical protein [Chitinophaga sp. S165]PWV48406.1 hypothetical protein C7475_107315 [Chitinophaga sp. S165]